MVKIRLSELNGWQRLYLIIAVIYSLYLIYFVITANDNYFISSVNIIVQDARKENLSKLDYLTYEKEVVEALSGLPDQIAPDGTKRWIKDFDIVILKDTSKAEEILSMQSNNAKDAILVKNYYRILANVLWDDAVIIGPSSIAWKNYLQLFSLAKIDLADNNSLKKYLLGLNHNVTKIDIEFLHPTNESIEKALNYYHQEFLRDIKSTKTQFRKMLAPLKTLFAIIAVFAICSVIFWAIPLLLLYFGAILLLRLTKWVKAGFKQ